MPTNKTHRHIAKMFKEHRLANGLTQKELAEKAGVNHNGYAKMERNLQKASVDTIEKLARALNLSAKDIFPF